MSTLLHSTSHTPHGLHALLALFTKGGSAHHEEHVAPTPTAAAWAVIDEVEVDYDAVVRDARTA